MITKPVGSVVYLRADPIDRLMTSADEPSSESQVCLIMGSRSDLPIAQKATKVLQKLKVSYELRIASAHRTPDLLAEVVNNSTAGVLVCFAGLAAALPGAVAALTPRPVIAVPCGGKVPFDSLLSTVQMPPGIPVAVVGVDRGENGALLAAQVLALADKDLFGRLVAYRSEMADKVFADDEYIKNEEM